MKLVEDPRAQKEDICRVTQIGATGIEWICVKKVHGKIYDRRSGDPRHRKGAPIFSDTPSVDQHYFVRRWLRTKDLFNNPSM